MDANQWTPLLHELGTIIAALAGAIAAVSSLRNGRVLDGRKGDTTLRVTKTRKQKNGSTEPAKTGDWYHPPDLD